MSDYPEYLQRAAEKTKEVIVRARVIATLSEDLRLQIEAMSEDLLAIEIAVGEQHTAKVRKRIERLTELRRAMEAGAFVMEVEREMNLAWKALP